MNNTNNPDNGKNHAIFSMVLGIISALSSLLLFYGIIPALIFGISAIAVYININNQLTSEASKIEAKVGLITAITGISSSVLYITCVIAFYALIIFAANS